MKYTLGIDWKSMGWKQELFPT